MQYYDPDNTKLKLQLKHLRSDPREEAREAIRPMTVLSPQEITTALQAPSTALVEKKARFLVSMGLLSVHSVPRDWGSDSPVREELSTWSKRSLVGHYLVTIRLLSGY